MPGEWFTINSRKYDQSLRRSWRAFLVGRTDQWIDLVGFFQETVEHGDLGRIEKGTVSRERFYLDRWYNYFIFEHPPGKLRNYYINICLPPTISDAVIDYVDLDIDLIVWPDGRVITVDMDDFERNSEIYAYPPSVRRRAIETLKHIRNGDPASIFEEH